ncbi:DoxX family protein [Isoalcanivorax indicus]|uniref:DoxX family protein n=1 Tax=Isoalcanivorax indicus TaxID=2202653 RepID=UPI000DBA9A91|nr:DoxX family protein [Isoalcanivorax indicus]
MNITLWILQGLLAFHTVMGAVWKFSNSVQTVPSLQAIPQGAWLGLGVFELFLSVALILPALYKPAALLAPMAALCIAAVMLLYCGLHLASGDANHGQMIYWLVVAAVCAFIAYGRFVLKPL